MFLCVQVHVAGANSTNGVWSVTYSRLTSYGLRFLHCSLWRAAWNLCDRIVAKKGCEPTSKGAKWLLCWSSQQVQAPRTTVLVMRVLVTCWYLIFYDVGREIFFAWYGGRKLAINLDLVTVCSVSQLICSAERNSTSERFLGCSSLYYTLQLYN